MAGEAFFKRPAFAPSWLAAMARPACSECGAGGLRWMQLVDLARQVQPELRPRVQELVGFLGPASEAWHCPGCGNFGAFA